MRLMDKFDRPVSMLAWGYNEEELVESFLGRAFALLDKTVTDWELVFVDDGSTDRTGEILADYARREPRLRVITHETNLNVGFACRRAIAEARKEILFWQTVDWSYDLTYLRIFLELLKNFDVVQGIRPAPERLLSHIPVIRSIYRIKSRSDTFGKAVVSLSNYYLLRLLYGVKFHDFQNITFYTTALVQSLTLVGKSSFVNPELLLKAHARGARFLEVPIRFIPRQAGEAKGTKLRTIIRSVRDVFGNWIDWGLKLRLERRRGKRSEQIFRVSQPVYLDEEVLEIIIPLFKCYQ
ncbi:MAG: glycosyltransferase family 2 protein [Desulfobaccales bacterium]